MSDSARHRALRIWLYRLQAELDAEVRFHRLARELSEVDAAPVVVELATKAANDEARHAELCLELIQELGGIRPPAQESPVAAPIGPSTLSHRARVLYEVVAMCCLTETLSTALLGTIVEQAEAEFITTRARSILKDEVDHARLGWAHLASEAKHGEVAFLGQYLPAMLAATVTEELLAGAEDEVEEDASGLGCLGLLERREIFRETMTAVVLPGLASQGVPTADAEAWLKREMAPS